MIASQISRRTVLRTMAVGGLALAAPRLARATDAAPVRIANASGAITLTMTELMKRKQFMEEMGLTPEVMNLADGSKITAGIISGNLDLTTMSGFGQTFAAMERGGDLKVLGGAAELATLGVFTTKPDVRTLKDLEGRTVGTGAIGALLHQLMVALLEKYQVDTSKVRFVNIGSSVNAFKAATVGTVDAAPGELAVLEEPDRFKVTMLEHGNMALELPDYTYQGAYSSANIIGKKRDVLVRTMAAYAKLYRFVQTPEAKDEFLAVRRALYPNAPEQENVAQWAVIQKYKPFAVNLTLSQQRLDYMQKLNVELGVQKTVLPYSTVSDMSIAQDALAMIG
ncbi:MAG: hypothetical protein GC186_08495 [Rhodobacteraceae bacterium]|nr:hypothetical protein [Paracoccaceae bacterium]